MADRTALVAGARGVVGTNLIEHLAADRYVAVRSGAVVGVET